MRTEGTTPTRRQSGSNPRSRDKIGKITIFLNFIFSFQVMDKTTLISIKYCYLLPCVLSFCNPTTSVVISKGFVKHKQVKLAIGKNVSVTS